MFYGAVPAVGYYDEQYGFADADYSAGGCHRRDGRQYLRELDAFRSHPRVWVLITHPLRRERDDILRYLDAVGIRRQSFVAAARAVGRSPSPAEAHLYDLSDPDRLRSTNAASFTVTPPSAGDYGCTLFEALSGFGLARQVINLERVRRGERGFDAAARDEDAVRHGHRKDPVAGGRQRRGG